MVTHTEPIGLADTEGSPRPCPNCRRVAVHRCAVRSIPGVADFGWRCIDCGHEWGFECFHDADPATWTLEAESSSRSTALPASADT